MPVSPEEVTQVLTDLTWLNNCHCGPYASEFFVAAGQIISPKALQVARTCPARRQEVIWAYGRGIKPGYFGGLSSGQRAQMDLDEALEFIETDLPLPDEPEEDPTVDPGAPAPAADGDLLES